MTEDILLLIFLLGYIVLGVYFARIIIKRLRSKKVSTQILLLSLFHSGYFGIGIASAGHGDPGFAIPMFNLLAIILMAWSEFYSGVLTGLIIWVIWYLLIALIMFVVHYLTSIRGK